MAKRHWQDWLSLAVGVWLFLTPIVFDYESQAAMVSAFIVGLALILIETTAITMPSVWEELVSIALGAWLMVSPWALGFTIRRNETETAVFVGMAVIVLSVWATLRDETFQKWWHDRHLTS